MRGEKARVTRVITLFRCVSCGDQTELVLRRGDRVDHVCNWSAGSTWWIHRSVPKR